MHFTQSLLLLLSALTAFPRQSLAAPALGGMLQSLGGVLPRNAQSNVGEIDIVVKRKNRHSPKPAEVHSPPPAKLPPPSPLKTEHVPASPLPENKSVLSLPPKETSGPESPPPPPPAAPTAPSPPPPSHSASHSVTTREALKEMAHPTDIPNLVQPSASSIIPDRVVCGFRKRSWDGRCETFTTTPSATPQPSSSIEGSGKQWSEQAAGEWSQQGTGSNKFMDPIDPNNIINHLFSAHTPKATTTFPEDPAMSAEFGSPLETAPSTPESRLDTAEVTDVPYPLEPVQGAQDFSIGLPQGTGVTYASEWIKGAQKTSLPTFLPIRPPANKSRFEFRPAPPAPAPAPAPIRLE